MTTETPIPTPAAPPRVRPRSASSAPAGLVVPAKPALVTGANMATLAATAAASGPVGLAAVAGVAVAATGGYLVRRIAVRRPAGAPASPPRPVGGPADDRRPSPRDRRAERRERKSVDRASERRDQSKPAAPTKPKPQPQRTDDRVNRPAPTTTSDRATHRPSLARRMWKWAKDRRAEQQAARKAVDRAQNRKDQTPAVTPEPKAKPQPRRTGDRVQRPEQLATSDRATRGPVPKPTPTRTTDHGGTPAMTDQPTDQARPTSPSSPFFHSARQVHAAAAKFQPKGMMEVRAECWEMPHSLGEIAAALRVRAAACTKQPLRPELAQAIAQIASCVDTAAQAARQLGPAFDALHPTEVARILKPRPDEQAWDTVNNRP